LVVINPPNGYRTIEVPEARKDDFLEVARLAYAFSADPEVDAAVGLTLDWSRTVALERDGTLAAVHASYPFTLEVPGSTVPCSGLSWVGVQPDHRRRGLLTSMISTHFARSLARHEAVSALGTAEPAIYGRFGYGSAADNLSLTLARGAALRDVAGSADLDLRLESADPAVHSDLIRTVHGAAGAGRPGWIGRTTGQLRAQHLADPKARRNGAEQLRIVTVRDADAVRGYALFRRTGSWDAGSPTGTVRVAEVAALDAAATHRLWSFLLDLDLMSTVESPMLAVDDALLSLLVDARAAAPRVSDNLWIRLLDLPGALAARQYAAPVDVVLEVTDDLLPANAGRWRVRTDPAGHPAEVRATSDPADLTLDVRDLGAAYLGGRSLAALARAGLVLEHRPGALLTASTAFGWHVAPLCDWTF
jgi:predicted acetyltransferase